MIELRNRGLCLALEPALGGSVAWFRDRGLSILRETTDEAVALGNGRRFGAFPLIPYSNRIRDGRFSFGGADYALAHDAQDRRHALHGTARFKPWQVVAVDEHAARLELDYAPLPGDWPFAYRAWQAFSLQADRLVLRLGLENRSGQAAPAGLGLHPYFPRRAGTSLQFVAGYVWEKDAADIPRRALPDAGRFDFSTEREIPAHEPVDHAYGGWDGTAVLDYPDQARRVTLRADAVFKDIVLYTPEDRNFFAVEPVTHRPDALNPNGDDRDDGMAVLGAGGVLEGTVELILTSGVGG